MLHDDDRTPTGIVGRCAPHHYAREPRLTSRIRARDLMYGGPSSAGTRPMLDVGRDDYYDAAIPGCPDLGTDGFLTSPTDATLDVAVEQGPGRVTSAPWPLIDCGTRCRAYPTGTVIALYAKPERDSTFEGWTGACTGTERCMVTIDALKRVTARFVLPIAPSSPR